MWVSSGATAASAPPACCQPSQGRLPPPQRTCSPVQAPLWPVSAAPPLLGSWAPVSAPVCLSPALLFPNAACLSWAVRCLPAACLPAACSKPSACRLLERTKPLPGLAPPPNPTSPIGAVPAGTPHQQDTGPAGVLPLPLSLLAPAVQARLGGSQMSLLARGWPSLTLEQNMGWGTLGPSLTVSPGWSASLLLDSQVHCSPQDQSAG